MQFKRPPKESVTIRLPPHIREAARAQAARASAPGLKVTERNVYQAIIEDFFNAAASPQEHSDNEATDHPC